ncbi:helix-turn-helix domain-containing protein [Streptomyces cellulosae]
MGREWALERPAEPLTLEDMARHAHMSVRTFTRRFRQETGLSPLKWPARRRLARARHLLESTTLPVARIAKACGFGDPVALRRQFHTYVGRSPAANSRTHSAPGVTAGR